MASDDEFAEFAAGALPRLLRFGHVLTGNPAAAEDLVQTALARAWRSWKLRRIDDPQAFVRKVMVNSYASWYRRRGTREIVTANPADRTITDDGTQRIDDRDAVWRALRKLPPRQRAVIVLRYYEELSELEIAAVMGTSQGLSRASPPGPCAAWPSSWPCPPRPCNQATEDRIRGALHDPRRQLPVWPDPMPRIRRPARRQRAGLAVAIGTLAAVIAVAIAAPLLALRSSTGAGPGLSTGTTPSPRNGVPATSRPPPPGWLRHSARAWPQSSWQGPQGGVSIDTPAAWHFNSNPAPALLSPTMLFAVGTGPVPTGGSCAPTAALKTLPANGALFVLYDSAQDDYTHTGTQGGYPPRPRRLRLGALGGPYACWGVKGYLIRFEDGGRYLQAQVVFGPRASASLRAEVTRSLNTLRVDPLPAT